MTALRDVREFEVRRDLWQDVWAERPRLHGLRGCVGHRDGDPLMGKWERVRVDSVIVTHDGRAPRLCRRCALPDDVIEVPSTAAEYALQDDA